MPATKKTGSRSTPSRQANGKTSPAKAPDRPTDTFTRRKLASILQAKWPALSGRQASDLVESIVEEIVRGLIEEGEVKLQGFGVFVVREKASRPGRNPRTGEPAEITSRKSVVFKASPILKDKVDSDAPSRDA